MTTGIKVLCWAIALCAAVVVLDILGIIVVVVAMSDQSTQAAERAATFLIGFEIVASVSAVAVLWYVARDFRIGPRMLSVLGFLLPQAVFVMAMGFFSLLALNR